MANNGELSRAEILQNLMDLSKASLLDFNPFDILGLDPRKGGRFPDRDTLDKAFARASKHTHPFATSGRLTLPPCLQATLAYHTLCGPDREPARAFWRVHHRSTWNPHAAVGSSEAGLPIPGQEGSASPEEADWRMAAAITAVESDDDGTGAVLLGPYYPARCSVRGDGSWPSATGDRLLLSAHSIGDEHRAIPTVPAVTLGSLRRWLEPKERANAVVAMLDHHGRYYRRVVPWTMAGEPSLLDDDDPEIAALSCPPASIDYLPRFRDMSEVLRMAVVREELALLQAQIDAAARRQ
ncbi:MAG: hypothetical protein M1826_005654 [Phylliscum demangeonii]|nr:MAG: hypothetical protein M1826_005654 [Phylliscum demangeonii]